MSKKLRCFLKKFTQLTKILHDRRSRRSRQIPSLCANIGTSKMLPVFWMLLTEVALVLLLSCKKILWLKRSLFIVVVLLLQSFLLSQLQILKMDPLGVHLPSSCYLNRTISRNSGTLGRPLWSSDKCSSPLPPDHLDRERAALRTDLGGRLQIWAAHIWSKPTDGFSTKLVAN